MDHHNGSKTTMIIIIINYDFDDGNDIASAATS